MINVQAIIYSTCIALLLMGYYFYHHLPISQLRDDVDELQSIVKNKNTTINNLNTLLHKCKEDQKVIDFEGYINGLSEGTDENITSNIPFTF